MILIDTSGLVAALDPRQSHHVEAARILREPQRRVLSPFVLAELDYLLATGSGQDQELRLLRDVARGIYHLELFSDADVDDAIRIVERYRDLELGLADASVVVLAERLRCWNLLTLDQRHFRTVSGPDNRPFRLLPMDAI